MYPSVTTVLNVIGKGDALKNWAAGEVAKYAVKEKDKWVGLDDEAAIDLLKREPLRSLDRASNRGTSVHAIAQAYSTTGAMPVWADGIDGYVKALKRFFDEHQPTPVLIESTVFNETVGYAGSFDMICKLDVFGDALVMLDYKTSKAVYPDVAAQLAAYAFAPEYADDNNKMHPMPKCERAVVVRFAADGTYEVVEANLQKGWEYFQAVRVVHGIPTKELLAGKVKANVIPPERAEELATWMRARVLNIKENFPAALQQLITLWSPMIPTFKTDHQHSTTELALIEKMLNTIEGDHSIPFVDGNPRATAKGPKKEAAKPKKPPAKPPTKVLNTGPVNKYPAAKQGAAVKDVAAKPAATSTVTKTTATKTVKAVKGDGDKDDDLTVDASEVDKIRDRLSRAKPKVQAAASQIAKDANATKHSISLSGKPSLRRVLIVTAMLDGLIQGDGSPDLLDAVIRHVGFEFDTVGGALGAMTIEEIQKVSSVLSEIKKNTLAVTYDKNKNQFKVQKARK